jgi:hypothetical protein
MAYALRFFFFFFFPRFVMYAYTKSCFGCTLSKLSKISKTQKENSNQNVKKKKKKIHRDVNLPNLRQLDLGVVCDWARLHETRRCGEMRLGFRGNKDEKHDIVGLGRWASTKSRKKKTEVKYGGVCC